MKIKTITMMTMKNLVKNKKRGESMAKKKAVKKEPKAKKTCKK